MRLPIPLSVLPEHSRVDAICKVFVEVGLSSFSSSNPAGVFSPLKKKKSMLLKKWPPEQSQGI